MQKIFILISILVTMFISEYKGKINPLAFVNTDKEKIKKVVVPKDVVPKQIVFAKEVIPKVEQEVADPIIDFSLEAYKQLEKSKIKEIKFNFERYLAQLLQVDKGYDNSYLSHKLTKIKNLILQDKYNFNFYFQGTVGYGRDISDTGGFTNKSTASAELVLTKRLYDGQKKYTYNKQTFLEQRLAELEYLKTKEQLVLLGLDIYTNLLLVQEQIKIQTKIKKYKQSFLDTLDKRAKVLKVVDLNKLNIQNEVLDIEKNLIVLIQAYKTYTHMFRQSIDFTKKGKLVLGWFDVSKSISNLYNLKKMAMAKNSDIAISHNQLKLSQVDIIMQHSRNDWEVDFNSIAGYKKTRTKTDGSKYDTSGTAWDTSLVFKYPIYERNDIKLNVQRAKIQTLQTKNLLNIQQKNILNLIEQKYNEYEQYNKLDIILKKQSKILTHTKEAYKQRYLLGAGTYKEFSEELKKHLDNENDFLINSINIRKSFVELSILTGDRFFGK